MIDYASTPNTSGSFPNVVALNVTSPGAGDGTPFIKSMIDDLWGARQAVMNHANLTPNATTESSGQSQFLTAIQQICGHPGEVIAWDGDAADPSADDIRLLPLNGQGVLRSSYPDLDAAVYVGDSDNPTAPAYYRATDAAGTSRSITGAYLILPDRRGYILRGLDTGAITDPDGAGRAIGDSQDYAIVQHEHYVWDDGLSQPVDVEVEQVGTGATFSFFILVTGAESTTRLEANTVYEPVGYISSDENRMINSATRWCIRY